MKKRSFRVVVGLAVVLAALAVPTWAQDTMAGGGVCCKAPGGETAHYPMLGKCPPGTTQVGLAECRLVEPTPIPTVAPDPTPVPTPWEPGKETHVPSWLLWLLGLAANKFTLPVAFGAVVIAVVAGARQLLALFGAKLGQKATYLAALLVSFLTAAGDAVADGVIAGQEWVVLLTTLATFVAAVAGYKLLFSAAARARIGK
ncbi:MAG TPA: hypothetical protein PLS53_12555 [Thermoanaerobaculaceae bacterium]|nr:hypothetical protein [Thermoanaerobaculaceae bacterium]